MFRSQRRRCCSFWRRFVGREPFDRVSPRHPSGRMPVSRAGLKGLARLCFRLSRATVFLLVIASCASRAMVL